jgi:hypothetical protein
LVSFLSQLVTILLIFKKQATVTKPFQAKIGSGIKIAIFFYKLPYKSNFPTNAASTGITETLCVPHTVLEVLEHIPPARKESPPPPPDQGLRRHDLDGGVPD